MGGGGGTDKKWNGPIGSPAFDVLVQYLVRVQLNTNTCLCCVVQGHQLRFRLAYTLTFSNVEELTGIHSCIHFIFSWTWVGVWQDNYILYLYRLQGFFFSIFFPFYNQLNHLEAQPYICMYSSSISMKHEIWPLRSILWVCILQNAEKLKTGSCLLLTHPWWKKISNSNFGTVTLRYPIVLLCEDFPQITHPTSHP